MTHRPEHDTGPLPPGTIRPADVCRALLAALDASDGRARKRKRDQTADGIGLAMKRRLLERAVADDPAPEAFEGWLLDFPSTCTGEGDTGAALAMARAVFDEWKLAHSLGSFREWLERGAPSDDAEHAGPPQPGHASSGEAPHPTGERGSRPVPRS